LSAPLTRRRLLHHGGAGALGPIASTTFPFTLANLD
jgi:hypothetical protein